MDDKQCGNLACAFACQRILAFIAATASGSFINSHEMAKYRIGCISAPLQHLGAAGSIFASYLHKSRGLVWSGLVDLALDFVGTAHCHTNHRPSFCGHSVWRRRRTVIVCYCWLFALWPRLRDHRW